MPTLFHSAECLCCIRFQRETKEGMAAMKAERKRKREAEREAIKAERKRKREAEREAMMDVWWPRRVVRRLQPMFE